MNFLAHLHLSYPHQDEMAGNFIGDYVKGKQYQNYPDTIAKGIILHRNIDFFTDSHPIHKTCRELFKTDYGLFSGVIVDMLFDHLLASGFNKYSPIGLKAFSDYSFDTLFERMEVLPVRVQGFLPKMRAANRLISYQDIEGIRTSLILMSNYTSLPPKTEQAINSFIRNQEFMIEQFNSFYPELINYVINRKKEL